MTDDRSSSPGPGGVGNGPADRPAADESAEPAVHAETIVNSQILDSVEQSTKFVFGSPAGTAIAYQKVAQACALAVQDATDYQRNVMSVSMAAQGKALALMMSDPANVERYATAYVLAMIAPVAAAVTAGLVGKEAQEILAGFPQA